MIIGTSELYDLVYSFKNYEKESNEITAALKELAPNCKAILDVGCGTAEHHKYLVNTYNMAGIDIKAEYIETASKKNPTGQYFVEDMVNFDLNQTYDVILCLFSAIGYAKTYESLVSALKCFHQHLKDDGVLIVEPWITKEKIIGGKVDIRTFENETYKICRMNDLIVEGTVSTLNFHFLVGKQNEEVAYIKEVHELGLYSVEEMKQAFHDAGFKVEYEKNGLIGRGLYYGRK